MAFQKYGALVLSASVLLSSCGGANLPSGFKLKEGDRGKAWIVNSNKEIVLSDVKRVFKLRSGAVVVETRELLEQPPYGFADCRYFELDERKGLAVPIDRRSVRAEAPQETYSISGRSCMSS